MPAFFFFFAKRSHLMHKETPQGALQAIFNKKHIPWRPPGALK
jgi:hypothetical protein